MSKRRPFKSSFGEQMTNLSFKAMLKFQIHCSIVLYCIVLLVDRMGLARSDVIRSAGCNSEVHM